MGRVKIDIIVMIVCLTSVDEGSQRWFIDHRRIIYKDDIQELVPVAVYGVHSQENDKSEADTASEIANVGLFAWTLAPTYVA